MFRDDRPALCAQEQGLREGRGSVGWWDEVGGVGARVGAIAVAAREGVSRVGAPHRALEHDLTATSEGRPFTDPVLHQPPRILGHSHALRGGEVGERVAER